ncbi:hypothetical protein CB0940_09228 [Cercospora beticola]|uniref:Uncharacterized protein n=1 Tax=Cercospora beticola TaxID=122368 RepID=A0A2G5HHN9_CERBT|nr:hypothetical protein CB0940_09228 [Cercospora beticola]PIA92060.1 hypothetical protein CB0940_09228 [Cercospora beticola]WPB06468.1 hypothetical protein RHO25_011125 [Cercospora beticola]
MADNAPPVEDPKTEFTRSRTTLSPPQYTGDAAGRVSAVTELLEHILLLAVASQCDEAKDNMDWTGLKMPGCGNVAKGGICLFRIQRVNKTFRNAVQGSTKLKQLIYLAPRHDTSGILEEDHLEGTWPAAYKPLEFMVSLLGAHVEDGFLDLFGLQQWVPGAETLVTKTNPSLVDGLATPYEQTIGKLPQGWHNPEASWRNIKICTAKEPSAIRYAFWTDFDENADAPPFDPIWQLGKDATLGYVFELYSIVLEVLGDYIPKKILMQRKHYAVYNKLLECLASGDEGLDQKIRHLAYLVDIQFTDDVTAMGHEMEKVIARRTGEIEIQEESGKLPES